MPVNWYEQKFKFPFLAAYFVSHVNCSIHQFVSVYSYFHFVIVFNLVQWYARSYNIVQFTSYLSFLMLASKTAISILVLLVYDLVVLNY